MRRLTFILISALLLLSACTPAVPTLSPEQVGAAAAATIAALPSPTPLPSASPTPLPSATPLPPALAAAQGHALIYVGGGNLFAWTLADGSRLLDDSGDVLEARISPDGQWIAYVRAQDYRDYSLWAVRADGTGERQLFSPGDFAALADDPYTVAVAPDQVEWAPGARTLAFSTRPVYDGPGHLLNNDLWLVDVEQGSVPQLLLAKKQGGKFYFSPDGQQIAVSQPDRIDVMNLDGGGRRELFRYQKVLTYSEYQYYVQPQWSPDGAFLRVIVPPRDPLAEPPEPTSIWTIPVGGGEPLQNLSLPVNFIGQAELSPDLQWVGFMQREQVGAVTQMDLHLVQVQGGADTRYKTNVKGVVDWAPDSKHFTYEVGESFVPQLGALGAEPVPLAEAPLQAVKWLDGESYVYTTFADGSWSIYIGKLGVTPLLLDQFPGQEPDAPILEVR